MDFKSYLEVPYAFEFNNIAFVLHEGIDNDHSNIRNFYNEAEEKNFLEGQKLFGNDWHYSKKPVNYKFNKLGYRTKNFDDIDTNNFFISYGCSFTEGVGLAEDEIWCSKLSELIGIDCFNLGKGGQGPEFVNLNSLCFLKNSSIMPRFVVIQWPSVFRVVTRDILNFYTCTPSLPTDHLSWNYYVDEIEQRRNIYSNLLAIEHTNLLWKLAGIPVIGWALEKDIRNLNVYISGNDDEAKKENLARDLGHFGPKFHFKAGQILYRYIIKELGNIL